MVLAGGKSSLQPSAISSQHLALKSPCLKLLSRSGGAVSPGEAVGHRGVGRLGEPHSKHRNI